MALATDSVQSETLVVFYEKPGCVSNGRQKALLEGCGHRLDVRDLLAEPWTPERLRPFFAERPVRDWFNPTAPRVKAGEVAPEELDAESALALMVADPLLVRRPLIEVGELRGCGFEAGPVLAALGVELESGADLQSCARPEADTPCPPPAPGLVESS